jgi:hypothetical protein
LYRLGQGDMAGPARVQVLAEALDGAALAGDVAALEHDHDPLATPLTQYWALTSSTWSARSSRS